MWLGLLSPLLYLIFAWAASEKCADRNCYLEVIMGIAGGMNVLNMAFIFRFVVQIYSNVFLVFTGFHENHPNLL